MYDEEIEKAVLYFAIMEKYNFDLDVNDFFVPRNRKIMIAINQLKAEKSEISILSVVDKINGDRSEITQYIANLGSYVIGTSAETAYNRLIDYSKKRQVMEMSKILTSEIFEENNIDNLIEKSINKLSKIQQRNEKSLTFSEQVIETMGEIEKNYQNKSDTSLYTGLLELDKILLGLHKQELTVIGARPGVGKTTLALQIAEYIAKKGVWIGFASLEMSDTQLIQKILARDSRINGRKLRSGALDEQDFSKIAEVCGNLNNLKFHLISKVRTIQEIEVKARQLKNKNELGLLIIDYIQLLKSANKFGSREQEVSDISRTLKLLSLELDIPIIGLCQLNRNANRNEPTLADLRESGAIEQDADNVIFLYQEEGQEEEAAPLVIAKVAKQRAGDTGKVKLIFKKSLSEFATAIWRK